jgi:bis(5'-nucleosidyl)-tetraphosphatase
MRWQHSAGLIPYHEQKGKRKYLLLLSALTKNELWEFPKGHIEEGEDARTAAIREFQEETGIQDANVVDGFKKMLKYFYRADGDLIGKTVTYFLAHTETDHVSISDESKDYVWADVQQASKKIRHQNIRKLLLDAEEYLNR